MDKQNVVYTYNGILFTHEKEYICDVRYNMDELENMLCEIRQWQKDKYCMILFIWNIWIGKFIETESIVEVPSGWEKRGMGDIV